MAVISISNARDIARLQRLALDSQGLLKTVPFGRGVNGVEAAIRHLGYIQIDTISVVERAHHHVLYSRVPGYKTKMLNTLVAEKKVFEYWSHAAAYLPMEDFRFSLPYKHAIKSGQVHWYKNPDRKLMRDIISRIQIDGPLRSRDLVSEKTGNTGWWDWKPAKKAIEQLYMEGDVMVSHREGMQKVYDLPERVLSDADAYLEPSPDEFAEHIIDQQIRCHGLVSPKGFTYLRKNVLLKKAVKTRVLELESNGKLERVLLNGEDEFFLRAGMLEQPMPRLSRRVKILSPFDNVLIQRERLKSIFKFNYQIECYVPAARRQFGYFCLPILYAGEFVGRMDCKVHRDRGLLEIIYLHIERGHAYQASSDRVDSKNIDQFFHCFSKELHRFKLFQQCVEISIRDVFPKSYLKLVNRAIELANS